MKIVGKLSTQKYSEVPQVNTLRWMFLAPVKHEEGVYQSSSGWIKCKDFFNDVVYARETGTGFSIYSFAGDTVGTSKGDDVVFLLKGLKEGFEENIASLNEYLTCNELPFLLWEGHDEGVILTIPSFYWESTYRISLLSFLIRVCNQKKSYDSWAGLLDMIADAGSEDAALMARVIKEDIWFNIPEGYQQYFYYNGPRFNGSNGLDNSDIRDTHTIHDNGMISWYNAMTANA